MKVPCAQDGGGGSDLARAQATVDDASTISHSSVMDVPHLDLLGLKCPLPALKLRKALTRLASGTVIIVECSDPLAAIDIPHLLRETGDHLESESREDGILIFTVRKA